MVRQFIWYNENYDDAFFAYEFTFSLYFDDSFPRLSDFVIVFQLMCIFAFR